MCGRYNFSYEIAPRDADGFFAADIYRIEQGRPVFSILTREPIESIAFIHNRIPVILPKEAMSDLFNPLNDGQQILLAAYSNSNRSREIISY